MNFILLGYIISWIAVIVVLIAIVLAWYEYSKLTPKKQAQVEIKAGSHMIVLIVSIVYIIVYHIS